MSGAKNRRVSSSAETGQYLLPDPQFSPTAPSYFILLTSYFLCASHRTMRLRRQRTDRGCGRSSFWGAQAASLLVSAASRNELRFAHRIDPNYMNFLRLKAFTSDASKSNHSPPRRFASNLLCQYASMPGGSSVRISCILVAFSGS